MRLQNLSLQTDVGAVDLLTSILGVGEFARVNAGAVEVELFGQKVRVIGLDDLIAAKDALNREKDRLAATELRAIRESQKNGRKS